MARIAYLLDHEEGHLLPTFKLAHQLRERGHSVFYLGPEDSAELVGREGFDFVPVLRQIFPAGTMQRLRAARTGASGAADAPDEESYFEMFMGALARGEGVDEPVREVRPDLFIIHSFLGLNALVMDYRYGVPVVLLCPLLRSVSRAQSLKALQDMLFRMRNGASDFFDLARRKNPSARTLGDLTARLLRMRELVQCPAEFDLPRKAEIDPELFHIEASVHLDRRDDRGFPWERLDPGRKLLYVSLGSQSHLAGRETALRFLRSVAEGAARRPEWQLVLGTGGMVEPADLPLPPDAVALPWIPQIPVLERAALMVTHGGLGTIKECIFHDVPMVVFPISRDQPENARRVVHHGLGVRGELAAATPDAVFEAVERVDREPSFRESVARMGARFREVEASGIGVQRIEEVLARRR
jgi:MGT family glycosyltransferase